MPLSTDNQDYGEKDNKTSGNKTDSSDDKSNSSSDNKLTSDDLKGKKVDADPEKDTDKPADV